MCRAISSFFSWCQRAECLYGGPVFVQPDPCSLETLEGSLSWLPQEGAKFWGLLGIFCVSQKTCLWVVGRVLRPLLTTLFREDWGAFPLPFSISCCFHGWCCHSLLFLSQL